MLERHGLLSSSQDSEDGIDVCLTCFNGGCLSSERHHARTHVVKSNHPFTLNVKRRPKPKAGKQVQRMRHLPSTGSE